MEVVYGLLFFTLMVIPYRLIANPAQGLPDLIFGRTLLPALTFVCGMARGLIGGILTAFCLCGGMFM